MVHYCSVSQCRGKWRSASNRLRFHAFPKNEETRKLWQLAMGRLKPPSNSMKVCSRHFTGDDYQTTLSGFKTLKKGAVPSLFLTPDSGVSAHTYEDGGMTDVSSMRQNYSSVERGSGSQSTSSSEISSFEENISEEVDIKEEPSLTSPMQMPSFNCTGGPVGKEHISQTEWCQMLTDCELDYLSCFSKNCFQSLFLMLTGESLMLPSCNMSAQDQLLLTLCKYKHNFAYPLISIIFKIDQKDALAVFSFWTYHMFKTMKLHFGKTVKANNEERLCVSVGIVKVPVLEPSAHCAHHLEPYDTGQISSLKSLVVVDDEKQSVLYCSKLYGEFTSNESILQDMEFQQCVAPSTLIKLHGFLNISSLFPDKEIQLISPDNIKLCPCSTGGQSARCAFSSFLLTKRFQCLMEFYRILSDGIPPSLLIMSSEIFYNCMMLLNISAHGPT